MVATLTAMQGCRGVILGGKCAMSRAQHEGSCPAAAAVQPPCLCWLPQCPTPITHLATSNSQHNHD